MWICADCTRAALRGTGATPNSQKLLATTAHEKLLATTSVPVLNGDVTPKVGNDAPIETPASRRAIQPHLYLLSTDEMGGRTMLKFPSPQAANCARGSIRPVGHVQRPESLRGDGYRPNRGRQVRGSRLALLPLRLLAMGEEPRIGP